jgi:hypothetical protein
MSTIGNEIVTTVIILGRTRWSLGGRNRKYYFLRRRRKLKQEIL